MIKIAYWNNYINFAKNEAFNSKAYGIGDDIGAPIIKLKEELEARNCIIETLDMGNPDSYDYVIFSDVPDIHTCCTDVSLIPKKKKILVLTECEMIYKANSRTDLLKEFEMVFTYNDNLVKNVGYKKLCLPIKLRTPIIKGFKEKKFSTIIAGNKESKIKGELYSERLKTIRFMEKNHLCDFDLYGIGWDLKTFSGIKPIRALNRFNLVRKLFTKKHPSYKGKINKKIDILSNYKFSFCYENTCLIPGYISEKIWDCFFAGCVPIYYGAPNITDYIPENCFIDRRKFKNYSEIYNYLKNLSEEDYMKYIENINNFLNSSKAYPFSAECFTETILNEVLNIK